jgi:hypothetical protein
MNNGSVPTNFWDRSFRLTVDGQDIAPTSDLNEVLDGRSLRYGIVSFRVPRRAVRGVLHIIDGENVASVPLNLAPTGRPAVDERSEIADSQALRSVVSDPAPLIDAKDLQVSLTRITSRRFANTVRLIVSFRITNRGRIPEASGSVVMRVEATDALVAPWQSSSDVVDAMSTFSGTATFDLPTTVTKATLRTSYGTTAGTLALEIQ